MSYFFLPLCIEILELPFEIIFNIFSLLDPFSLAIASSVCKKWNCLSKDDNLWEKHFTNLKSRVDQNPREKKKLNFIETSINKSFHWKFVNAISGKETFSFN